MQLQGFGGSCLLKIRSKFGKLELLGGGAGEGGGRRGGATHGGGRRGGSAIYDESIIGMRITLLEKKFKFK
jgi:hypothetical protein